MKIKIYTLLLLVFSFSLVFAQGSINNNGRIDPTKKSISTEMRVFPNPAVNVFNISSAVRINKVEIYSLIGKKLKTLKNLNGNSFDISDLRNGIYIVRIFDLNKKVIKVQRLSINHNMP